jgi:hypothetical protein
MRKALRNNGILLQRIENVVGTGRPDVDALAAGVFTPIELKAVDGWPKRKTTPVLGQSKGLSRAQRNWHIEWQLHGGRSLIVVSVGTEPFALLGRHADLLNHYTEPNIRHYASARDWSGIAALLRGY